MSTELKFKDIQHCVTRTRRYWGGHLYVLVEGDSAPNMDWRRVLIPKEYRKWTIAALQQTLLHEWGHRMVSPKTQAIAAVWRKAIVKKAAVSERVAALIVNLATDIWVDEYYLNTPEWSSIYRQGMIDSLNKINSQRAAEKNPGDKPDLGTIYHAFYRQQSAEIPWATLDDLSADIREYLLKMRDLLLDDPRPQVERLQDLAVLLADTMTASGKCSYYLSQPHMYGSDDSPARPGSCTDAAWRALQEAGLGQGDAIDIFGQAEVKRVMARRKRLRMYARVVPVVKRFFRQRQQRAFSGYKPWQIGRPVRELDILATIQRSARMIPGTTTLARRFDMRGLQNGQGSGTVVLVIDDSGSTGGDVLEREQEAAMAVIAAARSFTDPVGCVVFGNWVTAALAPTTRYQEVEDLVCGLNSDSGGTAITPALERALEMGHDNGGCAIMIMTDAGIFDLAQLKERLRFIPDNIQIIVFVFGGDDDDSREMARMNSTRMRILTARSDKPFAENALEEIYG